MGVGGGGMHTDLCFSYEILVSHSSVVVTVVGPREGRSNEGQDGREEEEEDEEEEEEEKEEMSYPDTAIHLQHVGGDR